MAAADPKSERNVRNVGRDAAADADHDFNAQRGIFNFGDVWKSGYYKIGIPNDTLVKGDLRSEWALINDYLGLVEGAKPNDDAIKRAFYSTYVKAEGEIPNFKRSSEDDVEYVVASALIATGESEEEGSKRDWQLYGVHLYDFLNRNEGADNHSFVFTIDAASVPIGEGLMHTKGGGGGGGGGPRHERTARYVLSREGIVDGALKANKSLDTSADSKVLIQKVYDENPTNIAYPATSGSLETLHPTELFHSQFPIHIPPVRMVNGIRATSIEFTNRKKTNTNDVFKTLIDDKNPYTVSKLSQILFNLQRDIIGRVARALSREQEYYMCLQFKRAGDWLQVLACLFPERFGFPPGTRIRLITNDRICFLFALKMGIDVILTMYDKTTKQYWLVTFYKDTGVMTSRMYLEKLYRTIKDPDDPLNPAKEGSYKVCKDAYIKKWSRINEKLIGFLVTAMGNVVPFNQLPNDRLIQTNIQEILRAATRLSYFRFSFPQIISKDEEIVYTYDLAAADEAYLTANKKKMAYGINLYKKNYDILISTLNARGDIAADLNSVDAINKLFNDRFGNESIVSKPLAAKILLIDKFTFVERESVFARSNFNENGVNIFSYLNKGLTVEEKGDLIREILTKRSKISPAYQANFDKLIKVAQMLQGDDKDGGDRVEAPNIQDIPSIEILRGIFFPEGVADIDVIEDAAITASATEGFKGGAARDSNRDTHAQLAILAQRAQMHYGEAPVGAEAARENVRQGLQGVLAIDPRRFENEFEGLFEGGGGGIDIDKYNHNPLTTICFIIWEIICYLPCEDPDVGLLYKLSAIIEHIVSHDLKKLRAMKSVKEVYRYLYSLEAFLLEGLNKELPDRSINHFMAGVKEEYLGFHNAHKYKDFVELTKEEIKVYVDLKPKKRTIKELIDFNQSLLNEVLQYLEAIETTLLAQHAMQASGTKATVRSSVRNTRKVHKSAFSSQRRSRSRPLRSARISGHRKSLSKGRRLNRSSGRRMTHRLSVIRE
jgi:hypothetical protein